MTPGSSRRPGPRSGRPQGGPVDVDPIALATTVVAEAVHRAGLDSALVDDVVLGESRQGGGDIARHAAIAAGFEHVPGPAHNRHCASGLAAITTAAAWSPRSCTSCGGVGVAAMCAGGGMSTAASPLAAGLSPRQPSNGCQTAACAVWHPQDGFAEGGRTTPSCGPGGPALSPRDLPLLPNSARAELGSGIAGRAPCVLLLGEGVGRRLQSGRIGGPAPCDVLLLGEVRLRLAL